MKLSSYYKKRIRKFLSQERTNPIFKRLCGFNFLLAIYYAYIKEIRKECGCEVNNVLVYKNPENFYEFFVDFTDFTPCLIKKINAKIKNNQLHEGVKKYFKRVERLQNFTEGGTLSKKTSKANIFKLVSKTLAFQALSFIIPYLTKDLKIFIKDRLLIKKCIQARVKTEEFLFPNGKLDLYLTGLDYTPKQFKNYKKDIKEFIIFDKKLISNKEVVKYFKQLKKERFEERFEEKYIKTKIIKGLVVYKDEDEDKDKVKGKTKIILSQKDFYKMKKGDILVAINTTPNYIPVIRLASAIISDEGGFLSHAAIVSRELKIPCMVGTKIATKLLKDGDTVELNLTKGVVRMLK